MDTRQDLSNIIYLLILCNIMNNGTGTGKRTLHLIMVAIMTSGTILSFISVYLSDPEDRMRFASMSFAGLLISFKAFYLWTLSEETTETIHAIRRIMLSRNEPRHKEFLDKVSYWGWVMCKVFIVGILIFNVTNFATPILYDIYLMTFTESTEPFLVIFPYKGLLGKKITRNFSYFVLQLISYTWLTLLGPTTFGFYIYLFLLVIFTSSEMKAISDDIIEWGDNYKNKGESMASLKKIIKAHQEFLRVSNRLSNTFGLPFLLYHVIWPPIFTFSVYTISIYYKKSIMVTATYVVVMFIMIPVYLIACLVGQRIETESLKIFDSLCEVRWYEMTPKNRKDLNLMILRSRKPFTINYKSFGQLNLPAFMQMLNNSYSLLMLMYSMNIINFE